jgi:hypothetical protein
MSTIRARVLLGLIFAGIWLALLPAVALADTCKERADAIAAGQKPPNEVDPDCKRGALIGTTVVVAAAAAAAGVGAVQLGLGGVGPPVAQAVLNGGRAIDILIKAGLVKPVTRSDGSWVYEPDPNNPGQQIPKVKPVPGFDNLGGNPVAVTVGAQVDPTTGLPTHVQNQQITGVAGFAGNVRPDGTLDPNVAIVVNQTKPGGWVPPVDTTPAAPPPPPPQPPIQQQQAQPPQAPPVPPKPQVPPVDQPLAPPKPPLKPPVDQVPPQVVTPIKPPEPPQAPPKQPEPPAKVPDKPPTEKPVAKPPEVRTPTNVKDVITSIAQPGTTLINPKLGGFLGPDGTVVKLPGGAPTEISLGIATARIVPNQSKLDTSGGRVEFTATIQVQPHIPPGAPPMTLKPNFVFMAKNGKIEAVPRGKDVESKGVAAAINAYLNGKGGVNQQFDNSKPPVDVLSLSTDDQGMIRIVTKPRPNK